MNPDNQQLMQKIQELERKVADLEAWKQARTRQQITFPLDIDSVNVLKKHFVSYVRDYWFEQHDGEEVFTQIDLEVDGRLLPVSPGNFYIPFSVNTTNDTIIVNRKYVNNDSMVNFFSTVAAGIPGGLTAGPYYVINSTDSSFQVSTSPGGSVVDITSAGSGELFYYYVPD